MSVELTCKELTCVKEQLSAEKLLISKYNYYAQISTAPEIQEICKDFAFQHKQHYDKIYAHLG